MNLSNLSKASLACLLALAFTHAALHGAFVIEAPTGTFESGANVTLSRHDVDQRVSRQIVAAKTEDDGSIRIESIEEPGIFVLKIEDSGEIKLAIEEGESVVLTNEDDRLASKGSPASKILQEYERFRKESLARLVYPTRADIRKAKARNAGENEVAELTQAEVDAYQIHLKELNDFVIENAGITFALYGTSLRWSGDYRGNELAQLTHAFADKYGDIRATRSLKSRIQTFQRVALGAIAPNIKGQNLAGEIESLESYRGHYVLVDFWASWCPPCRVENRHYQKLIQQVDRSKFTLFAVSVDTNKTLWSRAIAQDRADWTHVSDLEGWTSSMAATYGITALPASFLLDPDGRILAKNLRGPVLEAKLKELGLL